MGYKVFGTCRVCGNSGKLTEEHIIPRAAGGGQRTTTFSGEEILKVLKKEKERPFGQIRQNGATEHTLCKVCNDHSGLVYDNDFADFFKVFHRFLPDMISTSISDSDALEEYLHKKQIELTVTNIKPFNIAKRILVSFCSVEYPNLTTQKPEIRKAIMNRNYQPDVGQFSIYLSLHIGNSAQFATQAAIVEANGRYVTQAFAGIEAGFLAFYLADKNEHLTGGALSSCVDITSWLTDYKYDEIADVDLALTFNKTFTINVPLNKLSR